MPYAQLHSYFLSEAALMIADIDLNDLRSFVEMETDVYFDCCDDSAYPEGYYAGVEHAIERAQEYIRLQMMET